MEINEQLKEYLDKYIIPMYDNNDNAHNQEHLEYVINRAIKIGEKEKLNLNIIYTAAVFHDVGHHINKESHEIVSAEILSKDAFIKEFFNSDELKIIKESVLDHRASKKESPRSIYGKVISSADRSTSFNNLLKRVYEVSKNKKSSCSSDIVDESYNHIKNKYGKNGYARQTNFFEDAEYEKFLEEVDKALENKEKFKKIFKNINTLD